MTWSSLPLPREGGHNAQESADEREVPWPASPRVRLYDLAQPLEPGIPHHPTDPPYAFALTKRHGDAPRDGGVTAAGELLVLGGHVGTHIDALSHFARDGCIHGDIEILERETVTHGMAVGDILDVAPLLAKGHLVDAPQLLERPLGPSDTIGADEFERWFSDRDTPTKAEVVLVRTGWDRHWRDPRAYLGLEGGCPGVSLSGARWLSRLGIAATGCDNASYAPVPDGTLEVQAHLLVEAGIPLMKSLRLESLAASGAGQFLFVGVPLPIRGATGSPIRPLAIVDSASSKTESML